MTDDARDTHRAEDATLLNLVRDGNTESYEVLCQRHEQAAYRLARCLVPAEETDDLVAEAFDQIFDVMLDGGGPAGAFRPYLLTALRRISSSWLHPNDRADSAQAPDPGEPLIEPAVADLAASPVARAFQSLPDRYIAVLWHAEIEQSDPAETGEILALYPGEVATLCHRAWDGLRQACVQLEIDDVPPECQPVLRLLAAFIGETASSHDRALVSEHLIYCDDCDAAREELAGIDAATLRTVVAPVYLGSAAAAYLSAHGAAAVPAATAEAPSAQMPAAEWEQVPAAEWEHGEPPLDGPRHASSRSRFSRPSLWIAAGAMAVTAVVLALAVTLTGAPAASAHHQQQPQAALTPVPSATGAGTPAQSPASGATTDPPPTQPAGSPGGSAGNGGGTGFGPTPTPTPKPQPSTTPPPSPSTTPKPSPSPTASSSPTASPTPTKSSQAAGR